MIGNAHRCRSAGSPIGCGLAVCVAATVLIAAPGLEAQPTSLTVAADAVTVTEGGSISFTFTLDSPLTQARNLDVILIVSEDFSTFKSVSHFVDPNAGVVFEPNPLTNILAPATNRYQMSAGASRFQLTIATQDDGVTENLEAISIFGALLENTGVGLLHTPPLVCVVDNDGGSQNCPEQPSSSVDIIGVSPFISGERVTVGNVATFSLDRNPQGEIVELPVSLLIEAVPEILVASDDRGEKVFTFADNNVSLVVRVPTNADSPFGTSGLVRATVLSSDSYEVSEDSSAEVRVVDDRDAPPDDKEDDDKEDDDKEDDDKEDDDKEDDDKEDTVRFTVLGAECSAQLCVTLVGSKVIAIDRTRNVVERLWTTSDGQPGSAQQRFRPVWPEPGCYVLSLEVKRANHDERETTSKRVHVRSRDGRDDGGCDDNGGADDDSSGADFLLLSAECYSELCVTRPGKLTAEGTSRDVAERLWTTSDGRTSSARIFRPDWRLPGYYVLSLTVKAHDGSTETKSRRVFVGASDPQGDCVPAAEHHCLLDQRYLVEIELPAAAGGKPGLAKNVYEGTNEAGLFWFFDESNWEVLVKVLDGCKTNGHHWVFAAATTDFGYLLRVVDTLTDREAMYSNEAGNRTAAVTDVRAFPDACRQ